MDRGAHVVAKAGERELCGTRAAADRFCRLEHEDGTARLRKRDRGRQSVWTGADDDGV